MEVIRQASVPLIHDEGQAQGEKWSYRNNSAVRDLLDHLAEELALEYGKLMEAAGNSKEDDR